MRMSLEPQQAPTRFGRGQKMKWRLLLPGASEPRLEVLTPRALIPVWAPHYAATATGA
jgi:hypothetical protein